MKQSINCHDFINAFDRLRPENFSRDALILMFEYFEEYERDIGEEIEFDPIGICCVYIESTIPEVIYGYQLEKDIDGMDQEQMIKYITEYITDNALLIGITDSGNFVYQQF